MANETSKLSVTFSFIVCCLFLGSCSRAEQQFSQLPGFIEYFKTHIPKDEIPDTSEQALLEQHRPKVYKAKEQAGPIDFYADYISTGRLSINGKTLSDKVTPELLNQHRDNPAAVFEYTGRHESPGTPLVYGRVDYEKVSYNNRQYDFTFLTYNLVFPVSGILKGLGTLQTIALASSGNLHDWHQLDHYVSVTVALLNNQAVAMTLQQHNYYTTYFLDKNNPNISVDIASRSNELYPHASERTKHPAVSFLTAKNIGFVVSGKNKPLLAGYDITHGEQEVEYKLGFLPQTDAFYQFQGSLGKSRLLPGRSGPPGADYATLPGLMSRVVRLVTGYRTESVELETTLQSALFDRENFAIRPYAITDYKERFFKLLNN